MAEVDGIDPAPAAAPAQDQDSFGDAFAERAGLAEKKPEADEPKEETQPAPGASADEPADSQGAKPFDPWSGLSDEQKSFFESIRHSESSQRGRVSSLQKQINELKAATPPPAAVEKPGAESQDDKPNRAARLKEAAEEYPEAVGALVEAIVDLEAKLDAQAPKAPATEGAEPDAAALETEYAALENAHPDYRQIGQDPSYSAWVGSKSKAIQNLANSYSADDVASVLTLYKAERTASQQQQPADTGKPDTNAQKRERQLQGSKAVQSRGPGGASGPASDDFHAAFAARAAQKR